MAKRGRGNKWVCPDPALLGTMPDYILAEMWDVSSVTIYMTRRRLGIAMKVRNPYVPRSRPAVVHGSSSKMSMVTELIGTGSDIEIARKVGCSPSFVAGIRRRDGRPSVPMTRDTRKAAIMSDDMRAMLAKRKAQ